MFSTITVLAVTNKDETVRCLRAMSFLVIRCDHIEDILDHLDEGDILYLDTDIRVGTDTVLMIVGRWARDTHRPVCLAVEGATKEQVRAFRVQGVWDICEKWDDGVAELQAIFRRYGSIMLDIQKIEQLEAAQILSSKKILTLQRAVIGLALMVAAIGGIEILPKIMEFFPIL